MDINIDNILARYEIEDEGNYCSVNELISRLERVRQKKRGPFKFSNKSEAEEISSTVAALRGEPNYRFISSDGSIMLSSVNEYRLYHIASYLNKGKAYPKCLTDLRNLAMIDQFNLARYLYAYLVLEHGSEYVFTRRISIADAWQELSDTMRTADDEYRRLAEAFRTKFRSRIYDCFEYALCPYVYFDIYCYRSGDFDDASFYLDHQIRFNRKKEQDDFSFQTLYLYYEMTRRVFRGIGYPVSINLAKRLSKMLNAMMIGKDFQDLLYAYDFERKKFVYFSFDEFKDMATTLMAKIEKVEAAAETDNAPQRTASPAVGAGGGAMTMARSDDAIENEFGSAAAAMTTTGTPEEQRKRNWENVNEMVEKLNKLRGLASVKKKVAEIVNSIKAAEYKHEKFGDTGSTLGTMHLVFIGNAGTGKTMIARILGKIYGGLGVLSRPDVFVECGRADLVGQFVGSTAQLVKKAVNKADGGILFIDEAYALLHGDNDTFGQEAVDTLISEIENHRNSLMVIIAGYKKEMSDFLDSNQGLRSRFATKVEFDDYSAEDMLEIIKSMASMQKIPYKFDDKMLDYLSDFFKKKENRPDFGNARGVRNVFESLVRQKENSIIASIENGKEPTKEECYTISYDDVKSELPDAEAFNAVKDEEVASD